MSEHYVDGRRQEREHEEVASVTAESMTLLQVATVSVVGKIVGSRTPRPDVKIEYAVDRPQATIKLRSGDLSGTNVSRALSRSRDALRKLQSSGAGAVWLTVPGAKEAITAEEARIRREVLRKMVAEPDERSLPMHRSWAQTSDGRWCDVDLSMPAGQLDPAWQKRARQSWDDGDPAPNGFEYARRKDGRIVLVASVKLMQAANRVLGISEGAVKVDEAMKALTQAAPTKPPGWRLGPRCSACGVARNQPERVVAVQDRTSYAMTPKTAALEALTETAQFALDEGATLDEVRMAVFRAMGLAPDEEAAS